MPSEKRLDRRLLCEAADQHYRAQYGTKYQGLSIAVYHLALNKLVKGGALQEDDDWRLRLP